MALGHCRSCGGKVAGDAPTCPHCGAAKPLEGSSARKDRGRGGELLTRAISLMIWVAIILGVLVFLALINPVLEDWLHEGQEMISPRHEIV